MRRRRSGLPGGAIGGTGGEVIGVDISPEAIEVARQRAAMAGLKNVHFLAHDLNDLTLDAPVDALIGRLVLQYNADPARLLRHLGACVKPGGIVAFQEGFFKDRTYLEPVCQLYETTIQRVEQTFARIGTDPSIGGKLGWIFQDAGLPAPQMILHARVERGPDATVYKFAEQMVRSMLPLMERTGVATTDEVGLETLVDRLRAEVVALGATLEVPGFIGAWTRTPLTAA
ncbi:MAG TPA: class I SAM-dependent methyltransferase [Ktedonobacterales bacterium]